MKYLSTILLLFLLTNTQAQEAGEALAYDGINEYTTLGNPASLQLNDYTVTLWFWGILGARGIILKCTPIPIPETERNSA